MDYTDALGGGRGFGADLLWLVVAFWVFYLAVWWWHRQDRASHARVRGFFQTVGGFCVMGCVAVIVYGVARLVLVLLGL